MTEIFKTPQVDTPIDIQELRSYCSGNEELVIKLLHAFASVSSQYHTDLSDAVMSSNADAVRGVCHKTRGAASIIHAAPLVAMVSQIRQNSIDAEFDQAKACLPDLEKAFADISNFIEQFVSTAS